MLAICRPAWMILHRCHWLSFRCGWLSVVHCVLCDTDSQVASVSMCQALAVAYKQPHVRNKEGGQEMARRIMIRRQQSLALLPKVHTYTYTCTCTARDARSLMLIASISLSLSLSPDVHQGPICSPCARVDTSLYLPNTPQRRQWQQQQECCCCVVTASSATRQAGCSASSNAAITPSGWQRCCRSQ